MTHLLLHYLAVSGCLAVVLRQQLKAVVFLLIGSVFNMILFLMILGVVLYYLGLNFYLARLRRLFRSLLLNYPGRLLLILLICVLTESVPTVNFPVISSGVGSFNLSLSLLLLSV